MQDEYDQITAYHYSAFRPSLHLMILKECLGATNEFHYGLDVGCGTGQSSIALTHFCNKVFGIEPSNEMLQKSIAHPKVAYSYYDKKRFDFSDNHFDLLTFAGSLYYAKSPQLLEEVIRVSKRDSKIIIYDFEILLNAVLEKLNLEKGPDQAIIYNHEVNFDDLNTGQLQIEKRSKKQVAIKISSANVAHLLLSSKDNYGVLQEALGADDLHTKVTQQLNSVYEATSIDIDATTYMTVYRSVK